LDPGSAKLPPIKGAKPGGGYASDAGSVKSAAGISVGRKSNRSNVSN